MKHQKEKKKRKEKKRKEKEMRRIRKKKKLKASPTGPYLTPTSDLASGGQITNSNMPPTRPPHLLASCFFPSTLYFCWPLHSTMQNLDERDDKRAPRVIDY
jgi:hypothetical protein